jgi:hypothetical protein
MSLSLRKTHKNQEGFKLNGLNVVFVYTDILLGNNLNTIKNNSVNKIHNKIMV